MGLSHLTFRLGTRATPFFLTLEGPDAVPLVRFAGRGRFHRPRLVSLETTVGAE
jgi:hypothetical protein